MELTAQANKALDSIRDKIQAAKSYAIEQAANKMRDDIDARIFERGRRSDGAVIGQGTFHKDGTKGTKYEKRYAKIRQSEGLQVGFIDFKRTGALRGSIITLRTSANSIRIVFSDPQQADKAEKLDKMKGKTFAPTKTEIATAKRLFKRALKQKL
jgi:hypothetical protein